MKNLSVLLSISLLSICLTVYSETDLLIFNSSGDVYLKRGKELIVNPIGELFMADDFLIVIDGAATIINRENKRVSVSENKNYSYSQIFELMKNAEASLTNRYFSYVWERINKTMKSEVDKPGGVVRAYEILKDEAFSVAIADLLPVNEAVFLSADIVLDFSDLTEKNYSLKIYSYEQEVVAEFPSENKIIAFSLSDINYGEHGKYLWSIEPEIDDISDYNSFIIPEKNKQKELQKEFEDAYSEFSLYDETIRLLLLHEYFKQNKVFVSLN